MKRTIWLRLIAVILVISMVAAPVSAATVRQPSVGTNSLIGTVIDIIRDIIRDIFDDWFDVPGDEPTEPEPTTAPTEPVVTEPAPSEPEDPTVPSEPESPTVPSVPEEPTVPSEPEEDTAPETVLELVEDQNTVENGHLLRGVTYTLSQVIAQEPNTAPYALRGNTLTSAIGNRGNVYAVNAAAEESTTIYYILATGTPVTELVPGTYVIVNTRANKFVTNESASTNAAAGSGTGLILSGAINGPIYAEAVWEISGSNGSYTVKDLNGKYMTIGNNSAGVTTTATTLSLSYNSNWTINLNGAYLNDFGGYGTCAAGWNGGTASTDPGSKFALYAVTTTTENPDGDIPLVYFPVTMFNYDENDINPVTHRMEVEQVLEEYGEWPEGREWEGLHIGKGQPAASSYEYTTAPTAHNNLTWAQVRVGTYYSTEACDVQVSVEEVTSDSSKVYYNTGSISASTIYGAKYNNDTLTEGSGISSTTYYKTPYYYYHSASGTCCPVYIRQSDNRYYVYYLRDGSLANAYTSNYMNSNSTINLYTEEPTYVSASVSVQTLWDARDTSTTQTSSNRDYFLTPYYHKVSNSYYPVYISQRYNGNNYYVYYRNSSGSLINTSSSSYLASTTKVAMYTQETVTVYTTVTSGYKLMAGNTKLDEMTGTNMGTFVGVTLYTLGTPASINTTYAEWNHWGYKSATVQDKGAREQNMFYAGLVQNELAVTEANPKGELVFNVPAVDFFSYDPSKITAENDYSDGLKQVYEYVGLPFVLNDKGYYTFDSDENGVYFNGAPASGTPTSFNLMTFDYGRPQGWADMSNQFGDRSSNLWAPYNNNTNDTNKDAIEYNFGMRADLPFSMTPNGRIQSNDDSSEEITFNFAGDDDVWIFIDGKLAIDLGGKHNRIGAKVNFAKNTITYYLPESNESDKVALPLGCSNDPDFILVKQLFADTPTIVDEGVVVDPDPVINMSRSEFAINEQHSMSVFYMERGTGTSNCKIEFNLPMRDAVMVTKNITKSWSAEQDERDGEDGDGTTDLTPLEMAALANRDFYFTLYSKSDEDDAPVAVADANYYLLDADGNVLEIRTTGHDGRFPLRNGQTAKFMIDIPSTGVTYYVVEDTLPEGFLTPDFTFAGQSTYGFDYEGLTMDENGNPVTINGHVIDASEIPEQLLPVNDDPESHVESKSFEITARGSIEAIDTIHFICENFLNKELPVPGAMAEEDIIVIDYGLPVQIDPLHNDAFRGDSIEIVHFEVGDLNFGNEKGEISKEQGDALVNTANVTKGRFGNFEFHDETFAAIFEGEDNKVLKEIIRDTFTYTLDKQLTEVEVLTYVIKVTGTKTQEGTGTSDTDYCYAQAKLYIVPATIMYYEEDFTGLIKDLTSAGAINGQITEDKYTSPYQEPGVVGTVGDSTYGSDVAYLSDSHDSNGTSYHYDTTNGYVRFQYTFTGTGTSIFARTSATTGYMQVLLFNGALENAVDHAGDQFYTYYRDTYFEDTEELLPEEGNTLYNIPVYTEDDLKYGTYTVLVTVAAKGTPGAGPATTPKTNSSRHTCYDENGVQVIIEKNTTGHICYGEGGVKLFRNGSGHEFYLDGIRIMQPLNEDSNKALVNRANNAYATDGESNLDVVTLRKKLITDVDDNGVVWDEDNFVMLTDTIGKLVNPDDYINFGPKEEVYLAPRQTVTFSLKYWQPEGLKLYMGMKAPFGEASVNVGSKAYTLKNAADCYYDVTEDRYSLLTDEEHATDDNGHYLYTTADGINVIEMPDENSGGFIYVDTDGNTYDLEELTKVMNQYYIVTYTFTGTDSIVSLTNIKVVGSHEFVIIEENNPNFSGSAGGDNSGDELPEEEEQP